MKNREKIQKQVQEILDNKENKMQTFIYLMPLISGFYSIIFSFLMSTKNFRSALIFRILPFFLGLGCLFSSCKLFGWF